MFTFETKKRTGDAERREFILKMMNDCPIPLDPSDKHMAADLIMHALDQTVATATSQMHNINGALRTDEVKSAALTFYLLILGDQIKDFQESLSQALMRAILEVLWTTP